MIKGELSAGKYYEHMAFFAVFINFFHKIYQLTVKKQG